MSRYEVTVGTRRNTSEMIAWFATLLAKNREPSARCLRNSHESHWLWMRCHGRQMFRIFSRDTASRPVTCWHAPVVPTPRTRVYDDGRCMCVVSIFLLARLFPFIVRAAFRPTFHKLITLLFLCRDRKCSATAMGIASNIRVSNFITSRLMFATTDFLYIL